jgi:hypothetical protein
VLFMGLLTAAALAVVLFLWEELKLLAFDPDYLATLGYPAQRLEILLTALIVVSVIVGLQMVGVILMSAMLIAPAVGARQWTDRFSVMVGLAVLFAVASGLMGVLASSLRAYVATGPVIALYVSALALASLAVAPGRGLVWRVVQRQGLRRRFRLDTLLLHLKEQDMAVTPETLARQLGWSARGVGGAVRHGAALGLVAGGDREAPVRLTEGGAERVRDLERHLGERVPT